MRRERSEKAGRLGGQRDRQDGAALAVRRCLQGRKNKQNRGDTALKHDTVAHTYNTETKRPSLCLGNASSPHIPFTVPFAVRLISTRRQCGVQRVLLMGHRHIAGQLAQTSDALPLFHHILRTGLQGGK